MSSPNVTKPTPLAPEVADLFIPAGTKVARVYYRGRKVSELVTLLGGTYVDGATRQDDGSWSYAVGDSAYVCAGGLAVVTGTDHDPGEHFELTQDEVDACAAEIRAQTAPVSREEALTRPTPGPWFVGTPQTRAETLAGIPVREPDMAYSEEREHPEGSVAIAYVNTLYREAVANARLISAAGELADALEAALPGIQHKCWSETPYKGDPQERDWQAHPLYVQVAAALRKAGRKI